jgi:4-amino-4-deoxy-L-arabinose transferase-like glycosyltransferase
MTEHRWLRAIIPIAVFGLILGLYLCNITGWLKEDDEGTALYVTWRFAEGEIPYQELTTTKGPLFVLIGAGLIELFGPSIFALRAATALAILLGGYAWFRGLLPLYGLPAALMGAAAFLLSPQIYGLARIFRADSWMMAMVAGALGACLLGYHYKQNRWFIVSGTLLGLAMLTKVIAVLPFLGCLLFLTAVLAWKRFQVQSLVGLGTLAMSFSLIAAGGYLLTELLAPGAVRMILGSQGVTAADTPDMTSIALRALVVYAIFLFSNLVLVLGIPFVKLALPQRGVVPAGFLFICLLFTAGTILLLRGAVYPRYLAYTALGLAGLITVGFGYALRQPKKGSKHAVIVILLVLGTSVTLVQVGPRLLRRETGTSNLAAHIANLTPTEGVILTDYGELSFHARRQSIPQTGGIAHGWTATGLITGVELIEAMEEHNVSLVALHVPGGREVPHHLYDLQDWDVFYRYVQDHYRLKAIMDRTGQMFEIYVAIDEYDRTP